MALKLMSWLWLIPALPLLGSILNGALGKRLGKGFVRVVGLAMPMTAFFLSLVVFFGLVHEDQAVVVRGQAEELDQLRAELRLEGWLAHSEAQGSLLRVSAPATSLLGELAGLVRGPALLPEQVRDFVGSRGFVVRAPGAPSDPALGERGLEVGWARDVAPRAFGCDLGSWIKVGQFEVRWSLLVDRLSVLLLLVITGVGSLIHLYSTSYMDGEESGGYARYFSYLNLFLSAMLVLVMARDLLVLFIGWEGVGLCSYLLIGFHYQDRDNAACGTKAFVVNRIGDVGFVLGMLTLLVLVREVSPGQTFGLDTVRLNELFKTGLIQNAVPDAAYWQGLACLLLFIGATGKSAQLPLHLWLPDAMAGPTPVSALIHAATMVTAGVYMISRLSHVFLGATVFGGVEVLTIVAVVGVLTAFYAATSAIAQDDIKRVLAWSTISQLGYMFVGVGAAAFGGAVFHLVTHAFFKALLFLGAGSVIHACHTQSMRQMGGLRHAMPWTFMTMTAGALALAGVFPLCGFFSKDLILYEVLVKGDQSRVWLGIYFLGAVTAGLTAIYSLRLIGLTFLGEYRGTGHPHESPQPMVAPLAVLGLATCVAGLLGIPHVVAHLPVDLPGFVGAVVVPSPSGAALAGALEATAREETAHHLHQLEWIGLGVGLVIALVCAGVGFVTWKGDPRRVPWEQPVGLMAGLKRFLLDAWHYDEAINRRIVQPATLAAADSLWRWVDDETIDRGLVDGTGRVGGELSNLVRASQTGRLSRYAGYFVLGAVGLPLLAIFTSTLLRAVLGLGGAGH